MTSKNKPKAAPHLTRGSVLDDMGFTPAESLEIKVKADIYRDLMNFIKSQTYTQQKLVTLLGIPQPDVSNLINGRVAKFSVAKLIRFAGKLDLGAEVKLIVSKPVAGSAEPRSAAKRPFGLTRRVGLLPSRGTQEPTLTKGRAST